MEWPEEISDLGKGLKLVTYISIQLKYVIISWFYFLTSNLPKPYHAEYPSTKQQLEARKREKKIRFTVFLFSQTVPNGPFCGRHRFSQ